MSQTSRTPGPWTASDYDVFGPGFKVIANMGGYRGMPDASNARFIVRACNAHDELVAALQALLDAVRANNPGGTPKTPDQIFAEAGRAAMNAIEKATGDVQ